MDQLIERPKLTMDIDEVLSCTAPDVLMEFLPKFFDRMKKILSNFASCDVADWDTFWDYLHNMKWVLERQQQTIQRYHSHLGQLQPLLTHIVSQYES